tara:strand:+ start:22 stop:360 length:339 start_codon:yes stop_codon:yes gene_type:complete
MTVENNVLLVYVTCPDIGVAKQLARILVESRVCACANILPQVQSIYHWDGQIEDEPEALMLLKTTVSDYPALEALVKRHHPYDVPECVAVPIALGSADYLHWVEESVRKTEQ